MKKTLLAIALIICAPLEAGQVTIVWDANTEPTLAGYRVSYGQTTGQVPNAYVESVDVGNRLSHVITGLRDDMTYYFAVQAYDSSGDLSLFSDEISTTIAPSPRAVVPP